MSKKPLGFNTFEWRGGQGVVCENVEIAKIAAIGWIQANPEMFGTKPEMLGCRVKAERKT